MKKLFISFITAAVITATAASIPVRALYIENNANDSSVTNGYILAQRGEYDFLESLFEYHDMMHQEEYEIYLGQNNILISEHLPNFINYERSEGVSNDDVASLLSELGVTYETIDNCIENNTLGNSYIQFASKGITQSEAKIITSAMKEKGLIKGATIRIDRCSLQYNHYSSIADEVLVFSDDERESVEHYMDEHGIAYNIGKVYEWTCGEDGVEYERECENVFRVEPKSDFSLADKWHLFDGMYMSGLHQQGVLEFFEESTEQETTLEAFNYIDGDANCDGKLMVSDAVAILQYIANSEKYHMSAQGWFNADCDGEEGISGNDAIQVQKKDAGII